MTPSGNRFYHDHSPEFTSLPGTLIGGEHYISKVGQGMHQVSEISFFPQFYPHYVRSWRTVHERAATVRSGLKRGCGFSFLAVSSAGMSEAAYRRISFDMTLAAAEVLARLNAGMTFTYVQMGVAMLNLCKHGYAKRVLETCDFAAIA